MVGVDGEEGPVIGTGTQWGPGNCWCIGKERAVRGARAQSFPLQVDLDSNVEFDLGALDDPGTIPDGQVVNGDQGDSADDTGLGGDNGGDASRYAGSYGGVGGNEPDN